MKILIWGIFIFFVSFLLHLIIWKFRLPKSQTKVMLRILFGTLIIIIISLRALSYFIPSIRIFVPVRPWEYIHLCLFFISLALAYITTYSAIEVDSPSLRIIIEIASKKPHGLGGSVLSQIMTDKLLIEPRLQDLIRDKLIYFEDNKYRLTPSGTRLARIFIFYRNLLRTNKGG